MTYMMTDADVEQEVREVVMSNCLTMGHLPIMWYPHDGGNPRKPPPADPLTFRIWSDEYGFERDWTITERILDMVTECRHDGSCLEGLRQLAPVLRHLADEVASAVAERDGIGMD
jgi:hypothetical protein